MKRLLLAIVLVAAISIPAESLARPAAPAAERRTPACLVHRAWDTLRGFFRSFMGFPAHRDDGGGHNLPPPSTSTSGG